MSIWHDYRKLADHLETMAEGSELKEAALRSAVSRLYHAAWNSVRQHAEAHYGFKSSDDNKDKAHLRQVLRDRKQFALRSALDDAQQARGRCDYSDNISDLQKELSEAKETVKEVFDRLDRLQRSDRKRAEGQRQ